MQRNWKLFLGSLLAVWTVAHAENKTAPRYLTPPAPIPQILNTLPPPSVALASDHQTMVLMQREGLPAIEELAEPQLRLAGYRLNPRLNGPPLHRVGPLSALTFEDVNTQVQRQVQLPPGTRLFFPRFSPDGKRLAFTRATREGLEVWVAEAATGKAHRVTPPDANAAFGASPFVWMPDSQALVVARTLPFRGKPPEASRVPEGPVIEESSGKPTPAPTYEDLLQSPQDEALFDYYFTSRLFRVPVNGGPATALGEPGIYSEFDPSPDGRYLLVTHLVRPYSYRVRAERFPTQIDVLDAQRGTRVKRMADLPLAEDIPILRDAARQGPRDMEWRADAKATLAWVEAQDQGDPRIRASIRDRVFLLEAPFSSEPRPLVDLEHRCVAIDWGTDSFALVTSSWWKTRWQKRLAVNPSQPGQTPRVLVDRSFEDRYHSPGDPVRERNAAGKWVLALTPDRQAMYLDDEGASAKGNYPFLARMEITTGKSERIWQAEDPYYERFTALLTQDAGRILTRRESPHEAPNYFVRSLTSKEARKVTDFPDPAPQFEGVSRQIITYPRKDGVMLSATLYLPPGYDAHRDGPLPLLMWAYPQEFKNAAAAAQLDDSPNRFSRPAGPSHLHLLTQGYAILDGPTMPIIGQKEVEPNDTYVEQLTDSATAAVDKVVALGVADRNRIAVGGHSYGAFMTANLLAHTRLFRAGIARSGAYNRTLTPFGFQAEERTYWEARDTYTKMSPFSFAHELKTPLLLIHGAADDNPGTFPVQSERFYAALKGHGATVRYVSLPFEAHGYRARESVMHTVAEMVAWLDKYVKNAPPQAATSMPSPAVQGTTANTGP